QGEAKPEAYHRSLSYYNGRVPQRAFPDAAPNYPGVPLTERRPVPPIIDSHLHLVTAGMFQRLMKRRWELRPQARAALTAAAGGWADRIRRLEGRTLRDHADDWAAAFDRAGVETGFFIAVGEGNEELAEFVGLNPSRFQAWGSVVDPLAPEAAATVRRFREW